MTAKKIVFIFLFPVFLFSLKLFHGNEKITIAVSIAPQEFLVVKLAGDTALIQVMIPSGADPHTYEPKPEQVRKLASASIFFAIGGEFEQAWLPRFRSVNPGMKTVFSHEWIKRLAGNQHQHGGHAHQGEDPHVWLAPPLMLLLARSMAFELVKLEPGKQEFYLKNLESLSREIVELDLELMSLLADLPEGNRTILVNHPAWDYFCRFYGLEQLAVETGGKEPKPRDLQKLINQAKSLGFRKVFVEKGSSHRSAAVVAKAIGAEIIEIDPLSADWAQNLREVGRAFYAALKK